MAEGTLAPEIVERIKQRLLREHPELEGAKVAVTTHRQAAGMDAVAAKAGLPAVEQPAETHYIVTLRKDVQAEDGVTIPMILRVTVDAQGRVVKSRQTR